MRKFLSWVLLCSLVGIYGNAALPPTTSKGQLDAAAGVTFNYQAPFYQFTKTTGISALIETGNSNLLKNPGFEATTFSDGWTKTGAGTWVVGTTTNIGMGAKSLVWDPVGGGENVRSTQVPIPEAYKGQPGQLWCYFRVPTGANESELSLFNGTSDLAVLSLSTVGSSFTPRILSFTFPTSGTVGIGLSMGTGTADAIAVDGCYLGLAVPVPPTVVATDFVGTTVINTVRTISAAATAGTAEETIIATTSGSGYTLSLPPAASVKGKKYHIVWGAGGTNQVVIDPNGAETVCSNATISIYGYLDNVTIQSTGTAWVGLNDSCMREEYWVSTAADCTTGICAYAVRTPGTSLYWNSTGNYTATFGFAFSAPPACTYAVVNANNNVCASGSISTTGFTLLCYTPSVLVNTRPAVRCRGTR